MVKKYEYEKQKQYNTLAATHINEYSLRLNNLYLALGLSPQKQVLYVYI